MWTNPSDEGKTLPYFCAVVTRIFRIIRLTLPIIAASLNTAAAALPVNVRLVTALGVMILNLTGIDRCFLELLFNVRDYSLKSVVCQTGYK